MTENIYHNDRSLGLNANPTIVYLRESGGVAFWAQSTQKNDV